MQECCSIFILSSISLFAYLSLTIALLHLLGFGLCDFGSNARLPYLRVRVLIASGSCNSDAPFIAIDYKGDHNWSTMLSGILTVCGVGIAYKLCKIAYLRSIRYENVDDDLSDRKDFIVKGKVGFDVCP